MIEHARENEVHLLCLPSHTSHVLQPCVFKSFKSFFSIICNQYMAKNPGRVITEDILASLVGSALAQSHTPINIFSGFKKAGIYPFNPGEVSDRQLAPLKALTTQKPVEFSQEQVKKFERQFTEGYDINDPTYLTWKRIYHPSPQSASTGVAISESPTSVSASSTCTAESPTSVSVCGASSTCTTESSTSVAVCGAKSVIFHCFQVLMKCFMNC